LNTAVIIMAVLSPFIGRRPTKQLIRVTSVPICHRLVSTLAYEWISGSELQSVTTAPSAVFLHGLLGNRKNWRNIARKVVEQHPQWKVMLVDLRGHGGSNTRDLLGHQPDSLEACAQDLSHLFAVEGATPQVLCGHSFGGKVVLQYLKDCAGGGSMDLPRHSWVLDTLPGQIKRGEMASVTAVLEALQRVPPPFVSRDDMVQKLSEQKLPRAIVQWLTTNLVAHPDPQVAARGGLTWTFDLDVIQRLFSSYCATSFLDFIRAPPAAPVVGGKRAQLTVLRAGRNLVWNEGPLDALVEAVALANAAEVERPGGNALIQVQHVDLPKAGHWVHVDDPAGLMELMHQSFQHIR